MPEARADDVMGEADKAINEQTILSLEDDAARCTKAGNRFFGVAILIGLVLLGIAYQLTIAYVGYMNDADNPELMLVLLLVRGTLFGGLSIGFLYGIFTVGNAYIDQATRFRKRVYSAHMLNYAFDTFSKEIKEGEKVKIDDVVRLFYAWNATVDSAFSRVAFQKSSKNLVIGGGNQRLAVEDPLRSHDGRYPYPFERALGITMMDGDWTAKRRKRGQSDGDEAPA